MAASTVSPQEPDAAALQQLWASAYEGWVEPPGARPGEVVYLSPSEVSAAPPAGESEAPAWVVETLAITDQSGGVFGITAFNPMGQHRPHKENTETNALLEADLKKLCGQTGGTFWRSFGFAESWHEKGFTVAAPQDEVVALAKKYKQGAVYRFYRAPAQQSTGPAFMRATVPASLPDTDADVLVLPCARPALDRADPLWMPAE